MADEPTTTVKPVSITSQRVKVQYIDPEGRLVTICPPAYAEGAEGQRWVRPRGYVELGDD